jgi:hypothetical protein
MTDPYEGQLQPQKTGWCTSRDKKHEWRLIEGARLYDNGRYVGYRFYCVHCLKNVTREE